MKLDNINNDHLLLLRRLLFLKENEVAYGGNDIDNYWFEDCSHCLIVDGGAITADIEDNIVYNIGCWSDTRNNMNLMNVFIRVLRYCYYNYDIVYFSCYKSNSRLSNLMMKKFECEVIKETEDSIYYKYTRRNK